MRAVASFVINGEATPGQRPLL